MTEKIKNAGLKNPAHSIYSKQILLVVIENITGVDFF